MSWQFADSTSTFCCLLIFGRKNFFWFVLKINKSVGVFNFLATCKYTGALSPLTRLFRNVNFNHIHNSSVCRHALPTILFQFAVIAMDEHRYVFSIKCCYSFFFIYFTCFSKGNWLLQVIIFYNNE